MLKAVRKTDAPDWKASISARILEAQDNERRKISRELHDSVGGSLAGC